MPTLLAQALYDNSAESPEELSFHRGDVMLVLERDAPSLGGWWRCSLRGQQGIAPGNRLQLLPETPQEESEYQAPRFLGVTAEAGTVQKVEKGAQERSEEPKNQEKVSENQTGTEVYQVPSVARLCLSAQPASAQDDIYNSPRLVGSRKQQPPEVYDTPSALKKNPLSALDTYDSPALRLKAADLAALVPEEIPEDIYDVPPTFNKSPSDDEKDEGVYSMPSNLKRASGLQNLYEAPEDILGLGHLPEILQSPAAQRLSVCSTGSTRSADSAGSRESNIPSLSIWEPRNDGTCTMEGLRMLHQELQVSIVPVLAGAEKTSGLGDLEDSGTAKKVLGALKDFLVMAHVAGLRSCQASDPALHRELSVHLDQLEHARELLDKGSEKPLIQLTQEHSNCFMTLVSANAGLLFPRPRLSSSESLSRRPLPALPTASPAIQRKGSIQDRPLPPPPTTTLQRVASDPSDDIHSEYERIQCRDNNYVHLQGSITAQNISKHKDIQTYTVQVSIQEEKQMDPFPELSEEDRHLLHFYATQSHNHLQTLLSCVGTFLASASSQPPRVFVGHGKQLVIAAHKLVFIGDTLGRLLSCPQRQTRLAGEGGALCQALKDVVLATKEAAALYPAPAALKQMAVTVSVFCTCAHSFTDLLQHLTR